MTDLVPEPAERALLTADDAAVRDPSAAVPERPRWDFPVAIVGLVVLAAVTATGAALGTFLGWAGFGCGTATGCNGALIMVGLFLGTVGVIIAAIVFLVITIARMAVGRVAWWVPLIGVATVVLVFLLGALLAGVGSLI